MSIALAALMLVPITFHAAAGVDRTVVDIAASEATAIWRDAGVNLDWRVIGPEPLRVEIGDERGQAEGKQLPVAWIGFVDDQPEDVIHASRANALALLDASMTHGKLLELPTAAVNTYVGRALGRAIAHEIGHYLFRSTAHDLRGVMATRRPADDFFAYNRAAFALTAEERGRLAAVLERDRVAQRAPSPLD